MKELNLPDYGHRFKQEGPVCLIFDLIRKKYVVLTPEEWVRQNFIQYLVQEKKYPPGLISVEHGFKLNKLQFRSDIVVFDRSGKPLLIVECKAPEVKIGQKVLDQITSYNIKLNVDWLIVTNGLQHYCCKVDYKTRKYIFVGNIPEYFDLS